MNKLSLFSGIGLDDLSSHWAGIKTVCMCEKDDYCQELLRKRFPRVPIIGDIHEVTKESVYQAISEARIDIISAGVPCQPVSVAGQRRGKADDRWLWDEALRVVADIQPDWVVFENPTGILSMAQPVGDIAVEGKTIISTPESDVYKGIFTRQEELLLRDINQNLEETGYETVYFIIPACGVGALHRRYRVFIVAHTCGNGSTARLSGQDTRQERDSREPINGHHQSICYPAESGLPDWARGTVAMPEPLSQPERPGGRRVAESRVRGMATRLPSRVDRLRGLGNAVVPQQVLPIYQAIVEVERRR